MELKYKIEELLKSKPERDKWKFLEYSELLELFLSNQVKVGNECYFEYIR